MEENDDIFGEDFVSDDNIQDNIVDSNEIVIDDNIFDEVSKDNEKPVSLIDSILKAKGLENSMVSILDEDGKEKEVNFYDLPQEEQLEILISQEDVPNEDLDDSEIELINHLRTNNLSIEDFVNQIRESIVAELQNGVETNYSIDAYNDHELFLLDLKNKYDLTDEELQIELEKELKNEDLFNKKISKLREEYKQLEDLDKANKQAEFESKQKEEYDNFARNMVNIATNVSDFHGVVLEDSEKEETLSYLLDLDEKGFSKFSKDLNDPTKLYEAAWYLRYGKEAFEALENAYEAEIAKLKKEIKPDKPRVVVQNSKEKITSINDLHI